MPFPFFNKKNVNPMLISSISAQSFSMSDSL